MTRVGVVGLGNLGLPVARRLARDGGDVVGYDVDPARREECAEHGIRTQESVRAVSEESDTVLVLTSDAEQAREVLHGPEGVCAATSPPPVVVVMATVGPEAVRGLAADLPEALLLVDCPVSGGAQAALDGQLALMVGGAAEPVAAVRPVLDELGTVHLLGDVGGGQAAKLANQIVFFAAQAALQEATDLTDSLGVDRAALLAALETGTADCWAVRHPHFFDETARAYDASGVEPSHRPWHKDLKTARKATEALGQAAPVTALLADVFGDRVDERARRSSP